MSSERPTQLGIRGDSAAERADAFDVSVSGRCAVLAIRCNSARTVSDASVVAQRFHRSRCRRDIRTAQGTKGKTPVWNLERLDDTSPMNIGDRGTKRKEPHRRLALRQRHGARRTGGQLGAVHRRLPGAVAPAACLAVTHEAPHTARPPVALPTDGLDSDQYLYDIISIPRIPRNRGDLG